MRSKDEALLVAKQFLRQSVRKVLLITGDKYDTENFQSFLDHMMESENQFPLYIDVTQSSSISDVLLDVSFDNPIVFIFVGMSTENSYVKYGLNRWQHAKVIFICEKALLHPTLDASIYFAPMKNNRIQKNLFSEIKLAAMTKPITPKPAFFASIQHEKKMPLSADLKNHFLNKKNMTRDALMMQMFADRVIRDNNFKNLMFKMVFASRNDEQMCIAAANAITILNYAGVSFSGIDLSHIKIPGADLSNAILDSTNFDSANLTSVIFEDAWLVNTTLSNCILKDIVFNQPPPIEMHEEIKSCCYSPDGKLLAFSFNDVIALHDAKTHQVEYLLIGHRQRITQIKFSHNSQYLASGSQENELYLWEIATGKHRKLIGHTSFVWSVAFSPDDSMIVTGSNDQTIKVWSTTSGKCLRTIRGHTNSVDYVSFINQGKEIISASIDDTICVWSPETGECIKNIETGSPISTADFTEDGQYAACSGSATSDFAVCLGEGIELYHLPTLKKTNLFLPDSLSSYANLRLMTITAVVFSHDTKMIAAANKVGNIYVWEVTTGILLYKLKGHKTTIRSLCFSPNNTRLTSVDNKGSLKTWDFAQKKKLRSEPRAINDLIYISDKNILAVAEENLEWNIINLLNVDNGALLGTLRDKRIVDTSEMAQEKSARDDSWGVFALAYSLQEKRLLSTSTDGYVRFWNLEKPMQPGSMEQLARLITYSADSKFVAWTIGDYKVCISAIDKRYNSKTLRDFDNPITAMTFSTDGEYFIAITNELTFNIWSTKDWQVKYQCLMPIYSNDDAVENWNIQSIVFNQRNTRFALANNNSEIYIYTTENWNYLCTLRGHTGAVRQLKFSPDDDRWLVSVGDDGIVCVWSTDNWQCFIKKIGDGKICSVTWSNDQETLMTGSKEGVVQAWRIILSGNQPHLRLLWTNYSDKLVVENVVLTNALELDDISKKILREGDAESSSELASDDQVNNEEDQLKLAMEMSMEPIQSPMRKP